MENLWKFGIVLICISSVLCQDEKSLKASGTDVLKEQNVKPDSDIKVPKTAEKKASNLKFGMKIKKPDLDASSTGPGPIIVIEREFVSKTVSNSGGSVSLPLVKEVNLPAKESSMFKVKGAHSLSKLGMGNLNTGDELKVANTYAHSIKQIRNPALLETRRSGYLAERDQVRPAEVYHQDRSNAPDTSSSSMNSEYDRYDNVESYEQGVSKDCPKNRDMSESEATDYTDGSSSQDSNQNVYQPTERKRHRRLPQYEEQVEREFRQQNRRYNNKPRLEDSSDGSVEEDSYESEGRHPYDHQHHNQHNRHGTANMRARPVAKPQRIIQNAHVPQERRHRPNSDTRSVSFSKSYSDQPNKRKAIYMKNDNSGHRPSPHVSNPNYREGHASYAVHYDDNPQHDAREYVPAKNPENTQSYHPSSEHKSRPTVQHQDGYQSNNFQRNPEGYRPRPQAVRQHPERGHYSTAPKPNENGGQKPPVKIHQDHRHLHPGNRQIEPYLDDQNPPRYQNDKHRVNQAKHQHNHRAAVHLQSSMPEGNRQNMQNMPQNNGYSHDRTNLGAVHDPKQAYEARSQSQLYINEHENSNEYANSLRTQALHNPIQKLEISQRSPQNAYPDLPLQPENHHARYPQASQSVSYSESSYGNGPINSHRDFGSSRSREKHSHGDFVSSQENVPHYSKSVSVDNKYQIHHSHATDGNRYYQNGEGLHRPKDMERDGAHPSQNSGYPPRENNYPPQENNYPPRDNAYPPQDSSYPQRDNAYKQGNDAYPPGDSTYPQQDNTYPQREREYPPRDNNYNSQTGQESYEVPEDEHKYAKNIYESVSGKEQHSSAALKDSFLSNHPDISNQAKIIVAEPVPGKPGLFLADGDKGFKAGQVRGHSSDAPRKPESRRKHKTASHSVETRGYGAAQQLPGSFTALVNMDPSVLRNPPELVHVRPDEDDSRPRLQNHGPITKDMNQKIAGEGDNYGNENSDNKRSKQQSAAYRVPNGIVQNHGDGVSSIMYNIRPVSTQAHQSASSSSSSPSIAQSSRQKFRKDGYQTENSDHLQYAKSEQIIDLAKPAGQDSSRKVNAASSSTVASSDTTNIQ